MRKHAGYCAAMRLGFDVPETWLLPHKVPPDNERFVPTAARHNRGFDLDAIGRQVGYPMYMKPFHGGGWVNVTRIGGPAELHRAYDRSGRELMHLFLSPAAGWEVTTFGLVVGAFFRWEFNSFEVIVRGGRYYPIDFANATPDMALISLGYYFPWAIAALARWCVSCAVTGRAMRLDQEIGRCYRVADDQALGWDEKLARYRLLVATVRHAFPPHEHEQMVAHHRGLLGAWAADQSPPAGV